MFFARLSKLHSERPADFKEPGQDEVQPAHVLFFFPVKLEVVEKASVVELVARTAVDTNDFECGGVDERRTAAAGFSVTGVQEFLFLIFGHLALLRPLERAHARKTQHGDV